MTTYDPIQLELFKNRFAAIAEEMGAVLRRAAYSPNIKERLDFSCAVFNAQGDMIAQAAHIPVHLGAMPISVAYALEQIQFSAGDVVILNDPFQGGSHLPDITMIAPIFTAGKLAGFVASRAHHADVGGMAPGSLPLSEEIYQEGVIIPPLKLVSAGQMNEAVLALLLANVRTPDERLGDLQAQLAANRRGVERLLALIESYTLPETEQYMQALLAYAERMTRALLRDLPNGLYRFSDQLDNAGINPDPVVIQVAITIDGDTAEVDFSGSASQVRGSVNAVFAVTQAAVHYVFRALIGLDIPSNSGCLRPIKIIAPPGTVVNAVSPAAVSAGNVETSQRITDVLLGALAQACPDKVPAASQGTMNNFLVGGWDPHRQGHYAYYETIGGGLGAGPHTNGGHAMHCHMSNTLNTPVEALEYSYPFLLRQYAIRRNTGGTGKHYGGDGICREMELLHPAHITLITERRGLRPYGLAGGEAGQSGRNSFIRNGETIPLPGKVSQLLAAGDRIRLETPGGGGWGDEQVSG